MSNVFKWEEFAGSARGLMGRPLLPDGTPVVRSHVAAIHFKVIDRSSSAVVDEGELDPTVVLLTAPSGRDTWPPDDIGYTMVWTAPGALWPTAGHVYQVILTFTLTSDFGGVSFKRVWQPTTVDAETVS